MSEKEILQIKEKLWNLKGIYEKAFILSEKALKDEKSIPVLISALSEIKEINKNFIIEKIKEL